MVTSTGRKIRISLKEKGKIILDGESRTIAADDVIKIPVGMKHVIFAETDLKIIEVQIGKDISVEDKTLWENFE